jgi:Protein of unknown function (DUF3037)
MPAKANSPFQYAVLRVVPDIERGEFLNAGVVLFARTLGFLAARVALDRARLAALSPGADPELVAERLQTVERVAAGDPDAGPIARLEPSERFSWLVAPASTVIQPSPVHTGLCDDPEETLAALLEKLVT